MDKSDAKKRYNLLIFINLQSKKDMNKKFAFIAEAKLRRRTVIIEANSDTNVMIAEQYLRLAIC